MKKQTPSQTGKTQAKIHGNHLQELVSYSHYVTHRDPR